MNILRFALRSAGRASVLLGALSALGAAFSAGLIAVVHRALEAGGGPSALPLALAFLACGLGKALTAYGSGRIADAYSQRSVAELRRELVEKLLAVPYLRFEQLGTHRAYAALTTDVMSVNGALQSTATAAVNAAVLVGGSAYLLYLDVRVFLSICVLGALGILLYRSMSRRARELLRATRAEHDRLFHHFEALTLGAKELKQSAARRRALLEGPLLETTQTMLDHALRSNARYLLGQAVNSLLVLAVIGFLLFVLAAGEDARAGMASGYVLAALYLVGPLSSLLRIMPVYASAEIALERIREVGVTLGGPEHEAGADPKSRPTFARIELRAVTHRYDEHAGFVLGPLSLSIEPGEIVFVAGGNGSGKSTLAKLLLGLYEPRSGEVLWDGVRVTQERRDAYRQLYAAVLSEFHVFDRLYGLEADDLDERAQMLIDEFGLSGVMRIERGALSSVDLSRGQRKRVALLAAWLEDRPIYVLDEWAADQDAEFRELFYRKLLPDLRRRGKAVVAITHDDRYFDVGDRVIRLRDGRAVEAERAAPGPAV